MIPPDFRRRGERARRLIFILVALAFAGGSVADATPGAVEPDRGRALYARCTGCHQLDRNAMGPLHCGVVGRAAAAIDKFNYSAAMRKSGIVWSPEALEEFLADPDGVVPGTKMVYAGVPDADDRRDLVAWLAWAAEHADRCRPSAAD